ncbi:hypothetical protein MKW92_020989 [Papaver armeniacum]|nr:hypothetical protein MKW92_020989 [Papaver armeniacum]
MTKEFFAEYLRKDNSKERQVLLILSNCTLFHCVLETMAAKSNLRPDVPKSNGRNPVPDDKLQQVGRMTGDTALETLLQKVRSMDLSSFFLEEYLEELNF